MDYFFSSSKVTKPCTVWYRIRNDITFFHYDFSLTTVRKRIKASTSCKILIRVQLSQNSWSISQYCSDASRSLLYFSSNDVGDLEWLRRGKCSVAGLPGNHSYVSLSWSSQATASWGSALGLRAGSAGSGGLKNPQCGWQRLGSWCSPKPAFPGIRCALWPRWKWPHIVQAGACATWFHFLSPPPGAINPSGDQRFP